MNKRTVAIIPVRTGSKRLKKKNTLDFFGKPLFIHTVEHAVESNVFDRIIVSSESEEVKKICESYGLDVPFMRPEQLASDEASLDDVCLHVLKSLEKINETFNFFCLLWATSPLRNFNDIQESMKKINDDVDAVISVTNYDLPPLCALKENEEGYLSPMFPEFMWVRSQDMPPLIVDNGSIAWVRVKEFYQTNTWMPKKSKLYLMPRNRSVDIDTLDDFNQAKKLYKELKLDC